MRTLMACGMGVAALWLLLPADAPGAVLARQWCATGIVTYDIIPGGQPPVTETQTTPVPVPYAWLDENVPGGEREAEAYEEAANAAAANGRPVWECYLTGVGPAVSNLFFRASLGYDGNGKRTVEWSPDLNEGETKTNRVYRVEGKKAMTDEKWEDVTEVEDLEKAGWHFFRVTVEMAE